MNYEAIAELDRQIDLLKHRIYYLEQTLADHLDGHRRDEFYARIQEMDEQELQAREIQ